MKGYYAKVIAEGIAGGEFAKVNPVETAELVCSCCASASATLP